MTRLIRIETCDECPYGPDRPQGCRATLRCDDGVLRLRKFGVDYPLIPDWCPLPLDGPDGGRS